MPKWLHIGSPLIDQAFERAEIAEIPVIKPLNTGFISPTFRSYGGIEADSKLRDVIGIGWMRVQSVSLCNPQSLKGYPEKPEEPIG